MTDQQLTFDENDIAHLVNGAHDRLRDGEYGEAAGLLERALELDPEYEGVSVTLKCVRFWEERRQRLEEIESSADRAVYLLEQWTSFRGFAARIGELPERCYQDVKHHVHASAVAWLLQTSAADLPPAAAAAHYLRPSAGARRLLLIGHSFKAMGDFANAVRCLEQARSAEAGWAPLLAELADCYSLIEETRAAKIFFREAFFLGAAEIPVEELESPMIRRLVSAVKDAGVTRGVREWVPVYGVLLGAFSVTRELTALEYGKLRQSIFELEQGLGVKATPDGLTVAAAPPEDAQAALIPRLIYRYFWLIEHYRAAGDDAAKVEEVLRRVKVLDAGVHQRYVS